MALNVIKQVAAFGQRRLFNKTLQRSYSLIEPDYLQTGKSKFPLYPTLDIKITGYDFAVLEKYQAYVHKIVEELNMFVENSVAHPHQEFRVQRFKPNSTIVETEYLLRLFERHLQVSEVASHTISVLIRILEATLPEGVTLNIDTFDPKTDTKRYIPDTQLIELQSMLQDIKKK